MSYGFEVNPFSYFISKVKTEEYNKIDIQNLIKLIKEMKVQKIKPSIEKPGLKIIDKLFYDEHQDILEILLKHKEYIRNVENSKYEDFLMFGWLTILEKISNSRKGGNGLKNKYRENKNIELELFQRQYSMMIEDIQNTTGPYKKPIFYQDRCVYCGQCEEVCPPKANAIHLTKKIETAGPDRKAMLIDFSKEKAALVKKQEAEKVAKITEKVEVAEKA